MMSSQKYGDLLEQRLVLVAYSRPLPLSSSGEVESYVQLLASSDRLRSATRDNDCFLDNQYTMSLPVSSPEPLRAMMKRVMAAPDLSDLTELSRSPRSPCSPRLARRRGSPCSGDYRDIFNCLPPPDEVKEEDDMDTETPKVPKSNSNSEMAQLEAALSNRRAKSAVHSRLRIKNLTLTPRHSLQQLLALQSGDAIDVRTSLAEIKLVKSSEDISILKSLTKAGRLEWTFNLQPQVATVGFSFTNFNNTLGEKGRFKSSSSGMISADADHSKNRSSCSEATGVDVDQACKEISDGTKSNTMSDGLFSQYCVPKEQPAPKKSEASADVQADCKEFEELFEESSNNDDRCLGKMVVDAMMTLVADANVESPKLQNCDSRPISSKNWMASRNSALTVVEKKAEYNLVVDVGVGSDETCTSAHPPQASPPLAHTENSVQTVDDDASCNAVNKTNDKVRKSKVNSSNNSIQYSSSLDILVGLLNEIQTITTCQTNMTNKITEKNRDNSFNSIFNQTGNRHCRVNHVLSISSLDKMRQLESNPSIYSYYISNASDYYGVESIKSEMIQTSCLIDKEVNTCYHSALERMVVSRPTDVPSMLFCNIGLASFPARIHQATSVGSLTVNRSDISLHGYRSAVSITEVVADAPGDRVKSRVKTAVSGVNKIIRAKNTSSLSRKSDGNNRKSLVPKVKNVSPRVNVGFVRGSDCDPLLKVKRDILVAVYSMLVFTVFAALSFPDLMAYS